MFENLPFELFEHVVQYLTMDMKQNMACCSRMYCAMMEPIIWNTLFLNFQRLSNATPERIFHKLGHCTDLRILMKDSKDAHQPRVSNKHLAADLNVNCGYNLAVTFAYIF